MTNIQKCIKLKTVLGYCYGFDWVVVKNNKLYRATWDESYHNGDISNYKETLLTEKEAESIARELEREYGKQAWDKYVSEMKQKLVDEIYRETKA
jgi:hypothetical protein